MSLCQITQEIITQNVDDQFLNKLVNNTSHYLLNKIDIEKKKATKKTSIDTELRALHLKLRFLVSCICNSHYIFMELREELFGILLCTWIYLYTASWACFAGSLWSVTDRARVREYLTSLLVNSHNSLYLYKHTYISIVYDIWW